MRYEYGSRSRLFQSPEVARALLMVAATAMLGLLCVSYGAADRASPYTLSIEVEGVANSRGVIGVLVFGSQAGWPESESAALASAAVPALQGVTEVVIRGLDPGEYAVVVLHDENENKKLDRNRLRLPVEQWGMSNNPKYFLSAPSFSDASFRLEGDTWINVRLN